MKSKMFMMSVPFICMAMAGNALADDKDASDYCEGVRARAAGDAAIFLSPSVGIQGIKYPATGTFSAVGGSTTPEGYQARLQFLWSPLDAYKSTLVRELGNKDCAQKMAMVDAQEALEYLNDVGKETALTAQVSYLTEHKSAADDILVQANKRLVAGVATIMDLTILQQAAASLDISRVQAQGELNVLQERSKHSSSVATKEENMVLIRKTLQQVYDLGKSDEAADEYIRTVE